MNNYKDLIQQIRRAQKMLNISKREYWNTLDLIIRSAIPDYEYIISNGYDENDNCLDGWHMEGTLDESMRWIFSALYRQIEDGQSIKMWLDDERLYIKDTIGNKQIYLTFTGE